MSFPNFPETPKGSEPRYSWPKWSLVGIAVIGVLWLKSEINKGLLWITSQSKDNTLRMTSEVDKGALNLRSRIQLDQ